MLKLNNRNRQIRHEGITFIPHELQGPELEMPSDYIIKEFNFDNKFKTFISNKSEWQLNRNQKSSGSQNWYTDYSKPDSGGGAGVYGPGINVHVSMGKAPTIFPAEVYAIQNCIGKFKRNSLKTKTLTFYQTARRQ